MHTLTWENGGLIIGSIFVGALVICGAIEQIRTGETRGLMPGRVTRADQPVYFWFLFAGRIVLGPAALLLGVAALR